MNNYLHSKNIFIQTKYYFQFSISTTTIKTTIKKPENKWKKTFPVGVRSEEKVL